ncbi:MULTISPECIES: hypothetical protein [Streptomyces]|uniref:hypothetical protein n=1 Tax=Streptomyces TaxID=1883 RepID=UPI0004C8A083|nr:hypothetical protein [Streptomyces sp. NRRL S-1868]
MPHEFTPPRYTWTASTAEEADNTLRAVIELLDAHLATLVPGGGVDKHRASKTAPVSLTVSLDLSNLIEQINKKRISDSLNSSVGEYR